MRTTAPCRLCGIDTDRHGHVCGQCRARRHFRARFVSGAEWARTQVSAARRAGRLADPSDYACNDCGVDAREYDHRDYNAPLVVDPVCRRCNLHRGSAIPKVWAPGEWEAYIAVAQWRYHGSRARSRLGRYLDEFAGDVPALMAGLTPEQRGDVRNRRYGHRAPTQAAAA